MAFCLNAEGSCGLDEGSSVSFGGVVREARLGALRVGIGFGNQMGITFSP